MGSWVFLPRFCQKPARRREQVFQLPDRALVRIAWIACNGIRAMIRQRTDSFQNSRVDIVAQTLIDVSGILPIDFLFIAPYSIGL
jgi:hypothetical protein